MNVIATAMTRVRDMRSRFRTRRGRSGPRKTNSFIAARGAVLALLDGARAHLLWRAYVRLAAPLTLAILVFVAIRLSTEVAEAARSPGSIGIDFTTVTDAARRWLNGASPYLARQLSGPYQQIGANLADSGEMLYPPVALPFFAVFSVLPAFLWWAVPAFISAIALRRVRADRWTWPIIGLCLGATASIPLMIAGNPTIWIVAGALWAPSLGWPGPLMLIKPSVAPLALLGIRQARWWIGAGILGIACLPFGSLWVDWFRSIVDMRTGGPPGALFSLYQLPFLSIPVIVAVADLPRQVVAAAAADRTSRAT